MENIIKMISTYGLAIVISSLVLFFAIRFGNILIKNFEAKHGAKKHDELAVLRNQVSSVINALLERIVLRTHADRVYVFEFHNGAVSLGGLPFLKFTNTYEALGPGAKSERHKRESMPFQLFQTFIDAVYTREYILIDVEQRTGELAPLDYEIMGERGIQVTLRAKITDLNRKVIGFLGIDFCKGNPVTAETAGAHVETLLNAATELGALLSVKKKG